MGFVLSFADVLGTLPGILRFLLAGLMKAAISASYLPPVGMYSLGKFGSRCNNPFLTSSTTSGSSSFVAWRYGCWIIGGCEGAGYVIGCGVAIG